MAVPFAGVRLGLTPSDLRKLLEDEEYKTYEQTGFLPERYAQEKTGGKYSPSLTATTKVKGRGTALGFQRGAMPTVEYSGPADQIREILQMGPVTQGQQMESSAYLPEPEDKPEALKTYQGIAQGVNIHDPSGIYGIGFGPGDMRRALEEGYSSQSISDYLKKSYQASPIAEGVARSLGIFEHPGGIVTETQGTLTKVPTPSELMDNPPEPTAPKQYSGVAGGVNIFTESIADDGTNYGIGFGPGDLRRAQEEGYSNKSIKDFLEKSYQGYAIPDVVRQQLGM